MHVTKVMLKMGIYPCGIRRYRFNDCEQYAMMAKRSSSPRLKSNVYCSCAFNQIIKALCDMRLVGDATILVDTLLKSDTKPDMITFTTASRLV